MVFGLSACGDGSAAVTLPEPTATSPEASVQEIFTTASGLECGQDLFEIGQYEPGFVEPASGFDAIQDAAADYWENGDGTYRDDRGDLIEVVDPPKVRYDNERGETQLILTFVEVDGHWLLESSEGCS